MNIRKGRSGHLRQARYFSCALSEQHLWVGLRYVEANPCRARLVETPEVYRWSSAATHLLGTPDRSRLLDLDFWQRAGGVECWREMHHAESTAEQIVALRKCTYSGRPFGDESFVTEMEQRFGRKWRKSRESNEIAISA